MKKIILILLLNILFLSGFVFIGHNVEAATPSATDQFNKGLSTTADEAGYTGALKFGGDPMKVIATVIKAILTFVGVLLLGLLVYAGFKWLKASGRESEVSAAKKIIENAIIGIVVVVAAYAITAWIGSAISNTLSGSGTTEGGSTPVSGEIDNTAIIDY